MDYGLSAEMSANDRRQEYWKKQREERGFDDTELWNLDVTIAKFILPRLIAFKEYGHGVPGHIDPDNTLEDKGEEKWNAILQEMIDGFDIIANDNFSFDKENNLAANQAIKLFAEHYFSLWN